jgi:NAD(P)-dependent dehydrogenase (short-subunit alcohol dehydrogenase family)
VLVWGATGGIGSSVARQLHRAGYRVFLAARHRDRLEALARELEVPWQAADARDSAAVEALTQRASETLGSLEGMAFCVGSVLLKSAAATTDVEWADTLALNLTAAFYALRAAVRVMPPAGGSIVLVSSAAARIGLPNHEAVAAAKAGVEGLVRAAAASYARRNIRVNAVAPGLVRTPLTAGITGNETALKYSRSLHALGRIGEPEEVASAIGWLLDPTRSWVTGQVLGVDGGLSVLVAR